MIGVKLKINVWNKNIHLPFFEFGENLHRPFEISWIELLEREAEKKVVIRPFTFKVLNWLSWKKGIISWDHRGTTFYNKTLWKFRIVFYLLVVEELFIDSFFDDSSSSGRTLPVMLKMFNIFLFNEMIPLYTSSTRD